MKDSHKPHKLYCYVDETGQDTLGKLFVVVAVITGDERQQLIDFLEAAERQTGGRRKQQWSKRDNKRREKYLDAAFTSAIRGKIFFEVFKVGTDFEQMTGTAIAHAIQRYSKIHRIGAYKSTIIIDGLDKKASNRVRKSLLKQNITIDKIRGERDQSSPIIRLADVAARLVRGATESKWEYRARLQKYIRDGIISEVG